MSPPLLPALAGAPMAVCGCCGLAAPKGPAPKLLLCMPRLGMVPGMGGGAGWPAVPLPPKPKDRPPLAALVVAAPLGAEPKVLSLRPVVPPLGVGVAEAWLVVVAAVPAAEVAVLGVPPSPPKEKVEGDVPKLLAVVVAGAADVAGVVAPVFGAAPRLSPPRPDAMPPAEKPPERVEGDGLSDAPVPKALAGAGAGAAVVAAEPKAVVAAPVVAGAEKEKPLVAGAGLGAGAALGLAEAGCAVISLNFRGAMVGMGGMGAAGADGLAPEEGAAAVEPPEEGAAAVVPPKGLGARVAMGGKAAEPPPPEEAGLALAGAGAGAGAEALA